MTQIKTLFVVLLAAGALLLPGSVCWYHKPVPTGRS